MNQEIQDYPMVDGNPHDSFEGLVELYFQLRGYITSSNKNFWVREADKKQRGYQDIDVLAIKESETVIVSVSSNLDDKVDTTKIHPSTLGHFERVLSFLTEVEEYRWLVKGSRKQRKIIAYMSGYNTSESYEKVKVLLESKGIELLSVYTIVDFLMKELRRLKGLGLKAENSLVRLMQVWIKVEKLRKTMFPDDYVPLWESSSLEESLK